MGSAVYTGCPDTSHQQLIQEHSLWLSYPERNRARFPSTMCQLITRSDRSRILSPQSTRKFRFDLMLMQVLQ